MSLTTAQMEAITSAPLYQRIQSLYVKPAPAISGESGGVVPFSVTEGNSAAGTMGAASPVFGASRVWSIIGGDDEAAFAINASTGALAFVNAPSTVIPGDDNGDNIYEVTIQCRDASNGTTDTASVRVTVNAASPDVGSNPPQITSPSEITISEGATAVATITADAVVTYSITGGADQAFFSIDADTGVLTFDSAPSYASPQDSGADNTYVVEVTASDGVRTPAVQTITATITQAATRGQELWAQPNFASSAGLSNVAANWTISGGAATGSPGSSGNIGMYNDQAPGLTVGNTYEAVITIDSISTGSVRYAWDGLNGSGSYATATGAGTFTHQWVAEQDRLYIYGTLTDAVVSAYSVKEVL